MLGKLENTEKPTNQLILVTVTKNKASHQTHPLRLGCKCQMPLAPLGIASLRELDKVHQY